MTHSSPLTFCISTYNNLPYLKLAIESVRKNSYYKDAPFIIHAENCTDGTDIWLKDNMHQYNLEVYIEHNNEPVGIGGGMNFCANKVKTEYIMFLHSDFYVSEDWDKALIDVALCHKDEKTWVFSHRIEPDMFNNNQSRPGTVIVPKDVLGAYYNDFNASAFEEYAKEFVKANIDYVITKSEGVSGLIKKSLWDEIGGNDSIFAPTSWEDIDLFLRMRNAGVKFILTGMSLVWHFGARGSHRLEENNGESDIRQQTSEGINQLKFFKKWGGMPIFDKFGTISGIKK
jgi:GT2 family glycosyltransferase